MSQSSQYAYHCDNAKTDIAELITHISVYRYSRLVPTNILVVGNPGSGKTTFCNRINSIIKSPLMEVRSQSDDEIIETLTTTKADGVVWIVNISKDRSLDRFQDAFKRIPQRFGRKLVFFFTHGDQAREVQVWTLNFLNGNEPYQSRLYYAPLTAKEDPLANYNALMPVKHIYDLVAARA